MPALNATDLSRLAAIKPPVSDLLEAATNARHYAELLIERKHWMQAIAYMSHAITPREAIWWGWFCARRAALPKSNPEALKALSLAEAWIAQPNEVNRIAARKEVPRQPSGSAPRSVLEAIDASGEMVDESTGEKLPAVPYLSAKYVNAAVLTAVYELDAKQPEAIAAEFLKQSHDVANRIQLWAKYS